MDRIRRSWEMGKASFALLRSNPSLMVFPIIATIAMAISAAIVTGAGYGILSLLGRPFSFELKADNIPGVIVLFLVLLVTSIITIYFNTALTGTVLRQLDGQSATLADGLAVANSRKRAIFGWGVITATVGILLSILREKGGVAGGLVSAIGDMAWSLATFFVVPILATHNIGPIDALKQSGGLFRRTWGEQMVGSAGIGLFAFLMSIPVVLVAGMIVVLGVVSGMTAVIVLAVLIAVALIAAVAAFSATLSAIYRTVLYRWATTGDAAPGFSRDAISHAFEPKGQQTVRF